MNIKINDYSARFLAVSDPHRREILMLLTKKEQSINEIAENFAISRPAISKHIKMLSSTGFIKIEEKGRERYCSLHPDGFNALQDWLNYFEQFWHTKLQKLENLLNKNDDAT